MWYPLKKEELEELLDKLLEKELIKRSKTRSINGIITPHAGYNYSGSIASKAYAYLKSSKKKKAIILSPSHYIPLNGLATHNDLEWQTPLGTVKVSSLSNKFRKLNLTQEHAIDNQIPFLQKIGMKEILPIIVGDISKEQAKEIAKQFSKYAKDYDFIISTDLSHFLEYDYAKLEDKNTIKQIINLNSDSPEKIDACGLYPLLILIELCKLKSWQPKLIEYKNSGDITGDKDKVVGYASLIF
jgi:AmmeMemoRadiSam system protein B